MNQDHKKIDPIDLTQNKTKAQEEEELSFKEPELVENETVPETFPQDSTEEEITLLKDQLLRALAESENIRKRAQREKEDASRFAIANFARDLLTVADNLTRALENIPVEKLEENEALKSILEGIQITERELNNVLERNGVKKVSPLGELFDHNYHQAMLEEESTEYQPGHVTRVLQTGYVLNERLLRPALVGVAKAKTS
jgi:molecular chaperone GrpE